MSKRITILRPLFYLFVLALSSCETERRIFTNPYHVRFTETSDAIRESYSKPIKIEVHNAGPALNEDITINYLISGAAREGVDYAILGERGKVIIPKNEYFGYIEIQLINNSNNILRSQDIVFTLQGLSSGERDIGQGESGIGKTFTFTILDDCILSGNYQGVRTAFSVPVKNLAVTSANCESYVLSNWNIDIFDFVFDMDLQFIDNGDNTITIPSQEEEYFPEDIATLDGFGVVNPTTGEIVLTIRFVDFEEQPEVTVTLIRD